jgi:hypothetical protein
MNFGGINPFLMHILIIIGLWGEEWGSDGSTHSFHKPNKKSEELEKDGPPHSSNQTHPSCGSFSCSWRGTTEEKYMLNDLGPCTDLSYYWMTDWVIMMLNCVFSWCYAGDYTTLAKEMWGCSPILARPWGSAPSSALGVISDGPDYWERRCDICILKGK